MALSAVPLGPFELTERIATGGVGEVWRGLHRGQQVPVAVKLVPQCQEEADRIAFRQEVRAVAALQHPHIVMVFDHGEVDAAAARASGGLLPEGTPWLAMELAEGGAIHGLRGRLDWPGLRTIVVALLDALAHAHARGVTHRDLKPGNVLLGAGRSSVKLTDFGIAQVVGRDDDADRPAAASGTPSYMAPEQFEGRWRDFGPWTDLYALGALAWVLATGTAPFRKRNWPAMALAHMLHPLPPFAPRYAMPRGLDGWLGRLLEKDPEARFRRAADAAWALRELEDVTEERALRSGPRALDAEQPTVREAPTVGPQPQPPRTLHWTDTGSHTALPPTVGPRQRHTPAEPAPSLAPRIPSDWRREDPATPIHLQGVGLSLFGLRGVPVVGRSGERDALWAALRRTRSGTPAAVVLRGMAGCGKSRLAEWLCERAHELGAAHTLTALHGPGGGPADGLGPMIARHLRCVGLARDEVRERLRLLLRSQDDELEALTELVHPAAESERASGRATVRLPPWQRWSLVRRILAARCGDRPTVLWIDDAQWGADALDFCTATLESDQAPLLFVVTLREDQLDLVERAYTALAAHRGCEVIDVGPLTRRHCRALVRELLRVEPALAEEVEARTAGNPLFAVQLVGDWVQRGVLVPTPVGFARQAQAEVRIPDDIHGVLAGRIRRVVRDLSAQALEALELAACLGQEVHPDGWAAAAHLAGLSIERDLVERLFEERLVRPIAGTEAWTFVHGLLRESLLRGAAEAGRDAGHHRACATLLEGADDALSLARRGRHLLAAGAAEESLEPLRRAAELCAQTADYGGAMELVEARMAAMALTEVPDDHPDWGDTRTQLAELLRATGRFEAARALVEDVQGHRGAPGWERAVAHADWVGAWLLMKVDLAQALERFVDLVPRLRELEQWGLVTRALHVMAIGRQYQGDLRLADALTLEALALKDKLEDLDSASAEVHRLRAAILLQLGELDEAHDHYHHASEAFTALGQRAGRAYAISGLGDVARFRGDLDTALRYYEDAAERLEACGPGVAAAVRPNIALVLSTQERYAEARAVFEAALDVFRARRSPLEEALIGWLMLPTLAGQQDWSAWDVVMANTLPLTVDVDVAMAFERAGRLAAAHGEPERAAAAAAVAERVWRRLGREDGDRIP